MSSDLDRPAKRRRYSDQSVSENEALPVLRAPEIQSRIRAKATAQSKQSEPEEYNTETSDDPLKETVPQTILDSTEENEHATFASLDLDPWLVTSLKNMSINRPTRIQKAAIPQIIAGRDCIGGSRTGSGKTVAFAAPILQVWARDPTGILAVVLTPTRELALQLYEQFQAIGAPQGLKSILVTGGAEMRQQAIEISRKPHIIIATPGRLAEHVDMSGEETISGLRRVKFVVLDEADRLLASGKGSMLPDVQACLGVLPKSDDRQTCLFTATVTPEVRALKDKPRAKTRAPVYVCEVDTDQLAIPPTLWQTYQLVNVVHKEKYLHVLLSTPQNSEKSTIIFCNRTDTATLIEHLLRLLEHRVTSLHSGLSHSQRTSNLARYRARVARILVATDVAARGLDIPEVGLVINYDLPRDPDDYIHRVGRTARAGRKGTAISLVGQRDVELVQGIEARVGKQMDQYIEDKISIEGKVVREALNLVGEKKREAMLAIQEGRDANGKRQRRMQKVIQM